MSAKSVIADLKVQIDNASSSADALEIYCFEAVRLCREWDAREDYAVTLAETLEGIRDAIGNGLKFDGAKWLLFESGRDALLERIDAALAQSPSARQQASGSGPVPVSIEEAGSRAVETKQDSCAQGPDNDRRCATNQDGAVHEIGNSSLALVLGLLREAVEIADGDLPPAYNDWIVRARVITKAVRVIPHGKTINSENMTQDDFLDLTACLERQHVKNAIREVYATIEASRFSCVLRTGMHQGVEELEYRLLEAWGENPDKAGPFSSDAVHGVGHAKEGAK